MMKFDRFNDASNNAGSIFTSDKNNGNSLKLGLKNVSTSEGTVQITFSQTNVDGGTGNDAPNISTNNWYYGGLSKYQSGNYQLFLCDLATGTAPPWTWGLLRRRGGEMSSFSRIREAPTRREPWMK